MNTYERQQMILKLLQEQGAVRVSRLAEKLEASEGTIRNDLSALEEQAQLVRIRGGAIPVNGMGRPAELFDSRVKINTDKKKKMARWASELVADGDVILLDASTTAYHMATYLGDRRNITVVTHHLETARLLNQDPSKRVILLGGNLRPDGLAVTGEIGREALKSLHINRAFVSGVGFSPSMGLMEADLQEADLKRQILESSAEVVALVDSSKFGKLGLKPFAGIGDIAHLVTDDGIRPEMAESLRQSKLALTICGESWVQSLAPQQSSTRHFRIGFANLSEALPFSIDVRRGLERAAKSLDHLDVIYVDNNLDGGTAIQLADALIQQGVDLVIEYQIDEVAGNVIMNKFKKRGIPVIAVDIPIVGATYFGVDNFVAGQLAGQALGQWIERHWDCGLDRVVVLEERRAWPLVAARIQGQLSALQEIIGAIDSGRILAVDSGNATETTFRNLLPVLGGMARDSREAFVCFNDDAAMGALQAVRQYGLPNTVIVGQGADRHARREIRDAESPLIGSTAFMPEQYGEQLVALALKILEGEPAPPAVYMQHQLIDAETIDRYYAD